MACICGHKHGAASPLAAGKPDVPGHGRLVFVWCDCHVKAAGARCAPPTGAAAYHKPDLQGTVLTVPKHESIASFRLCTGNHPSVCVADSSPQRGAKHDLRQDIGSPGGELDAKRPEGWFLANRERSISSLRAGVLPCGPPKCARGCSDRSGT